MSEEKEIQNKDVENVKKSEDVTNNGKNKKIIAISLVSLVGIIALIAIIIFVIGALGKPSKKVSEQLVKDYLEAVNDDDGDKFTDLIDLSGYVIYKEEDLKKFDNKYKDKEKYLKKYMEEKSYDEKADVKDAIAKTFKNNSSYKHNEYSLKEITSIKKSEKSKKVVVIKAKVKSKSKYYDSTDTVNLKMYVVKVSGEYKIVGAELD